MQSLAELLLEDSGFRLLANLLMRLGNDFYSAQNYCPKLRSLWIAVTFSYHVGLEKAMVC